MFYNGCKVADSAADAIFGIGRFAAGARIAFSGLNTRVGAKYIGTCTYLRTLKYNFAILVLILKSYFSFMDVLVLVLKYIMNVL